MRFLLGGALAVLLATTSSSTPAHAGKLTERVLGRVDPALRPYAGRVQFSADGKRYAYAVHHDGGGWLVVADGVAGETFDEVSDLRFAGDRVVYRANTRGGWQVIVGHEAGALFREVDDLTISPDGAHLAYAARTGGGVIVVFDGRPGPEFDSVQQLLVAGKRWAYVGQREGAQHAVVDGVVSEPFYYVRDLAFSADGKRCAYLANADGDGQHVVADRTRWSFGEGTYGGDVVWTGGGNVLAWWEKRGGEPVVVVEGKATPVTDPHILRVAVGPARGKAATITLIAEDIRRRQYVATYDRRGSRAGPKFFTADSPTFSRDGKRFAYRGWDQDGAHWIVDGTIGRAHDDVIRAGFSPDGKQVAYQAQDDRLWRMVVDGVAGDPSDIYDGIGPPVWSPDGRHLAYYILDGDAAVVLDGRRVAKIANAVELRWLARGKRLAFGDERRDGAIVWSELTP